MFSTSSASAACGYPWFVFELVRSFGTRGTLRRTRPSQTMSKTSGHASIAPERSPSSTRAMASRTTTKTTTSWTTTTPFQTGTCVSSAPMWPKAAGNINAPITVMKATSCCGCLWNTLCTCHVCMMRLHLSVYMSLLLNNHQVSVQQRLWMCWPTCSGMNCCCIFCPYWKSCSSILTGWLKSLASSCLGL